MSYTAPLRAASLWLFSRTLPFDVTALATSAGVTVNRAKQYITRLTQQDVLIVVDGLCKPSTGYDDWRSACPRSSPGGKSTRYVVAYQAKQRLPAERRGHHGVILRQAREGRKLSLQEMGALLGITKDALCHIEKGRRAGELAYQRAKAMGMI